MITSDESVDARPGDDDPYRGFRDVLRDAAVPCSDSRHGPRQVTTDGKSVVRTGRKSSSLGRKPDPCRDGPMSP